MRDIACLVGRMKIDCLRYLSVLVNDQLDKWRGSRCYRGSQPGGGENRISLHTAGDCTVTGSGESGNLVTKNCFADAADQAPNSGCVVQPSPNPPSYGKAFNSRQGGVYAMEWAPKALRYGSSRAARSQQASGPVGPIQQSSGLQRPSFKGHATSILISPIRSL